MWKEFKDFAVKGNVIDLAVGLVIGAAFATIVTALVDGIVMPLVGLLIGGVDFSQHLYRPQGGAPRRRPTRRSQAAQEAGAVVLQWGTLLNTIVTFLIVAFSIFVVVSGSTGSRRRRRRPRPPS